MRHPIKVIYIGLLFLGGCGGKPSDAEALLTQNPPPPETDSNIANTPPSATADTSFLKLSGVKGLMRAELMQPTCSKLVTAIIKWNSPTKDGTELWVGPEDKKQLVFAGGSNESPTIPGWVAPGQIFTLRASHSNQELDRLIIPGTACP